jgi:hypothetical protein
MKRAQGFSGEICQTFKEEVIPCATSFFRKIEEESLSS